jgi:hypothetical protein
VKPNNLISYREGAVETLHVRGEDGWVCDKLNRPKIAQKSLKLAKKTKKNVPQFRPASSGTLPSPKPEPQCAPRSWLSA